MKKTCRFLALVLAALLLLPAVSALAAPAIHAIDYPESYPTALDEEGASAYDITDHYQDGYYTFPFSRFYDMWREGPCAQKTEPYVQCFVAAWPKA